MPAAQAQVVSEYFALFVDQLANAASGGIVPPGMFARGVVERIGPEAVRGLLERVTADALLAAIERDGAPTALLNMDGRAYVQDVFREVRALV